MTSEEGTPLLQRFAALLYERERQAGRTPREAYHALKVANAMYISHAMQNMTGFCEYGNPDYGNRANAPVMLARFLKGKTIESPQRQPSQDNVSRRLRGFLCELGPMGKFLRKVTKPRHYVTAVWVDCPGYTKPLGYQDMALPALLEDAILQLERKWGISPVTNAPAGLFGDRKAGRLWRPTWYFQVVHIRSTRHLYSVLTKDHHVPVFQEVISLVALGADSMSTSSRAGPYRDVLGGFSTRDARTKLLPVVGQFPLYNLGCRD